MATVVGAFETRAMAERAVNDLMAAGFRGTTTINRADFGLVWNAALEGGGFLVGDEVEVEIELEATREA
jgi:polyisoprenoid-binding protein YceI